MTYYTIGHSTHTEAEFIDILKVYKIEVVVDVRTLAGSNYVPQFNQEKMQKWLAKANIDYYHAKGLGGLRNKQKEVAYKLVDGWRNNSFRNYAAYTLTEDYKNALDKVVEKFKNQQIVLMCSEALPWQCHRLLISDSLVYRKHLVKHIMSKDKTIKHKRNQYGAKSYIRNKQIIYPKDIDNI